MNLTDEEKQTLVNAIHVYLEGIEENKVEFAEELPKLEAFERTEAVCHRILDKLEAAHD